MKIEDDGRPGWKIKVFQDEAELFHNRTVNRIVTIERGNPNGLSHEPFLVAEENRYGMKEWEALVPVKSNIPGTNLKAVRIGPAQKPGRYYLIRNVLVFDPEFTDVEIINLDQIDKAEFDSKIAELGKDGWTVEPREFFEASPPRRIVRWKDKQRSLSESVPLSSPLSAG